jgi:tRNA-2-methylthio-N6-dimethylallyladenosine synthase
MNVNDSEAVAGLLEAAGHEPAEKLDDAQIILINTCCVRQQAEDKAIGYALGTLSLKMRDPKKILGLIGCIAEKDKEKLLKKLPFFDIIAGPAQEGRIVQLIEEVIEKKNRIITVGSCDHPLHGSSKRRPAVQAYITIMTGCDNFCSYCVVPYVRGREASRPAKEILDEAKSLDKNIFKEVILLGQNVNNYKGIRDKGQGLRELLEEVHQIDGIERIRFLTSHPRDMTDEIIDAVRDLPKVCEYFHLPLQSGDDEILKAMNRGYTSDHYRKLVGRIRNRIPEASITSDAIAGFPGETEEQFQHTLDLISKLQLDVVNTFAYSPRPGTPAEKLQGQISNEVRSDRLHRLMDIVERTAGVKNQGLSGTIQEVLVEREKQDKLSGRTRGNKLVKFAGKKDMIGSTVNVRITDTGPFVLEGELVS